MPRSVYGWLAGASLAACLTVPVLHFLGHVGKEAYESILAATSLCWFVFAAAWAGKERTAGKCR